MRRSIKTGCKGFSTNFNTASQQQQFKCLLVNLSSLKLINLYVKSEQFENQIENSNKGIWLLKKVRQKVVAVVD